MEGTSRSSLGSAIGGLGIGSISPKTLLGKSVLHVWFLDLERDREMLALHEETLSQDEWERVRRYSSRLLGRRFIARRGLLRLILGQYLGRTPKDIRFVYNAHGKPSLASDFSSRLQFSLSHSREKAALGVGLGDPIGIDIELLTSVRLDGGQASCGSSRQNVVRARSPEATEHGYEFLQAWTRREALAKAEGVGLKMLSRSSVLDDMANDSKAVTDAYSPIFRRGFHLHPLTLPGKYVGALAVRPEAPRIVYFSS